MESGLSARNYGLAINKVFIEITQCFNSFHIGLFQYVPLVCTGSGARVNATVPIVLHVTTRLGTVCVLPAGQDVAVIKVRNVIL